MKPLRMLAVLAVVMVATMAPTRTANSEPGGLHLNITPFGGYWDWGKEVKFDNDAFFGGRVGLGLGRHFGVEGYYSWMKTKGTDAAFALPGGTPGLGREMELQGYGGDLTLNLIPSTAFNPYLLGGWHEEKITSKADVPTKIRDWENGLEFGGGIKLGLGRKVAIRGEIRDKLWKLPPSSSSIHNLSYTGGLQLTLGGSAHGGDADKDGVKDKDDKCPNTPKGALVDATGCPIDSDKDGVPDGLDQCPNTPAGATVDARGCTSDADNDGVPDGIDQCPGTPAGTIVDARGCPADTDGDGVPDGVDRCPNTPTGAKVDATGCPVDSDNDGVPDGIDQCPNTPAGIKVDAHGCSTDSDNDGVPDDKDLCPNTLPNVKVDSDGCPIELNEKETELLDKGRITTREIHFETAKWDILPESRPVLDDIGKVLIQWPQLKIEIGGHTDARGSVAYNQDLSQKRAQAVLDYLLANFPQINREQYTAKGYGELKPVASNKTVEGMAKNRRVEFKVLNTEELTKERERRRLLKKGE